MSQTISSGHSITSGTVSGLETYTVLTGGTVTSLSVISAGYVVLSGGTAFSDILSGGEQTVDRMTGAQHGLPRHACLSPSPPARLPPPFSMQAASRILA